jgi:hypothetical protein
LQVDQARRLKELEQENAKLKRLVSELSLEKLVLKDIPDAGSVLLGLWVSPNHGAAEAGRLAGWQGPGGAHLAS